VNFGIKGKILPKTVEDGTPGGSAYLCIANATSPIGQGCDAASQQAYKGLMGKYAANIQKTACVQVMGGICVLSDFVNIQAVRSCLSSCKLILTLLDYLLHAALFLAVNNKSIIGHSPAVKHERDQSKLEAAQHSVYFKSYWHIILRVSISSAERLQV